MSEVAVRKVVARMISDPKFMKAFHTDPNKTIEESGYAVSKDELTALKKIKPADLKVSIKKRPIGGVAAFDVSEFSSVRTA